MQTDEERRAKKAMLNHAYREAHRAEIADQQRGYNQRHRTKRAAYQRTYRESEHGRAVRRAHAAQDGERLKDHARTALRSAIFRGRVVRGPCAECGDPLTHGHHHNGYDRAHYYDVTWLCSVHHAEMHRSVPSC